MKRTLFLVIFGALLLAGCGFAIRQSEEVFPTTPPSGAFSSNGAQIYYTGVNSQGERIAYQSGPDFSSMMGGQVLACASCHGPDGRGGEHFMHMNVMDAPDIRYTALSSEEGEHGGELTEGEDGHGEYDLETFRMAVVLGQHPDGESLDEDMPRWQLNDQDLADLFEFIKTLH